MPARYSPLFEGYNRWGSLYGTMLPRAIDTFRSGDFSPFEPIQPTPIDVPQEPGGRPRPRRFQFPVGWNLPVGQPGTEGIKLANFQVLRDISEISSIVQTILNLRKADILAFVDPENLASNIVPIPSAEKAMQGNPGKRKDFESRRDELVEFWKNPDPDQFDSFEEWLSALIEDQDVIDAVAIHLQPPTAKNSGPFGSNIGALALVDGSTIRPLLSTWGTKPRPPEVAYQQLIWGVPRVDLMDIINLGPDATIDDLLELNPLVEGLQETIDEWSGDQLLYVRNNRRNWTPYGFGPLEQGLLPASIMLARQQWQWEFYQSGSLPAIFLDPGEMIATPEEARELQEAINALGSDLSAKHQVIVTPPGAKPLPQREYNLSDDFDLIAMAELCQPFGYTIADIGMTPKATTLQSPAAAKEQAAQQADQSQKRATIGRARRLQRLFTKLIQVQFAQEDMMWTWGIEEQGSSENELFTMHIGAVKGSVESIDEARIAVELEPLGTPISSQPLIFLPQGVVTLDGKQLPEPAPPMLPGGPPGAPPGGPHEGGGGEQGGLPRPPSRPQLPAAQSPLHQADESVNAHPSPQQQKMLLDEFEILDRYLKRGRPLERFVPKAIHPQALWAGKSWMRRGDRYLAVRAIAKAHVRIARRDGALAGARAQVSSGLTGLLDNVRSGRLQSNEFLGAAGALMRDAFGTAVGLGIEHAVGDLADQYQAQQSQQGQPTVTASQLIDLYSRSTDLADLADIELENIGSYLTSFLMTSLGGTSDAEIAARANLYGDALTPTYEQAYGGTATQMLDDPRIIWHSEEDACDLCGPRDGMEYTEDSLPGWPGDGGFGDLCDGGPQCRCSLEYVDGSNYDTGSNSLRDQALVGDLSADYGPTGMRDQWAAERAAFTDQLPDAIQPGETTSVQARAQMRDQVRQQIAAERGIHPADVPAADVANRVPPSFKLLDHPLGIVKRSSLIDEVHQKLSKTYPDKALEWVGRMAWHQATVPVEKISVTGPSSKHDLKDIMRKAKKMRAGKEPKPVILIDPGDSGLLQVADGHHRVAGALAADKVTMPAYVGTPPTEDDAWRKDVMSMQLARATKSMSVGSPLGSSFAPFDLSAGVSRVYPGATVAWAQGGVASGEGQRPPFMRSNRKPWKPKKVAKQHELYKAGGGNAEALANWYVEGADGAIDWGTPGDFDQCVAVAGQYLDDAEGYCNLRHQDAVGGPPGSEDKLGKAFNPDQPRDPNGQFASGGGSSEPSGGKPAGLWIDKPAGVSDQEWGDHNKEVMANLKTDVAEHPEKYAIPKEDQLGPTKDVEGLAQHSDSPTSGGFNYLTGEDTKDLPTDDPVRAVLDYRRSGYLPVNGVLRGGGTFTYYGHTYSIDGTTASGLSITGSDGLPIKDEVTGLDKAISMQQTTAEDMVTYRGLSFESAEQANGFLSQACEGCSYTDHGFVSTSHDQSEAMEQFGHADTVGAVPGVLVEMHIPSGSQVLDMNSAMPQTGSVQLEGEQEVLLPRDSSFTVTKVTSAGDSASGLTEIQMVAMTKKAA